MGDTPAGQKKFINDYLRVKKDVGRTTKKFKVLPVTKACASDDSKDVGDDKTSAELNELRQFDQNPKFGPSIDSSRMERWIRAEELGLKPPIHIKKLILDHQDDTSYSHPIWQRHPLLS